MKLTLIDKKRITNGVKTFIFKPEKSITWKAGQYLIYSLPHQNQDLRGKMRFFTISSPPFRKNPSITTRIEKTPSSFKKTLDSLKIGNTIEAKGPDGDFIMKNLKNKYVFIAGGIGITPFNSIIKELNKENKPINITLLYANKDKNNIPFKADFEEIAEKHPEFKIEYVISPKRIDEKLIKKFVKNKSLIFYISGPDPMVEALEKTLESLGVPKENVQLDYFSGYKNI